MSAQETKSISLSPKTLEAIEKGARQILDPDVNITNEKIWDTIADDLMMAGMEKTKVAKEVCDILEKKAIELATVEKIEIDADHIRINSGQFYRWARKREFTNPFFARNKNQLPQGNDADSSDFTQDLSEKEPFSEVRKKMIFIFQEMRNQLKENIKLLRDEKHTISEDSWKLFFEDESDTKKLLDQIQSMMVASFSESNKCRDARQIILPTDRFLSIAIASWVYNSWYCKKYHAVVKARHKITPKKFSIFINDTLSKSNLIYHTMLDPLNLHFLDIKCPECGRYSLKTMWNVDGTWHIVCINEASHSDKKVQFPASLIEERLQQLDKNTGGARTAFLRERGIDEIKGT